MQGASGHGAVAIRSQQRANGRSRRTFARRAFRSSAAVATAALVALAIGAAFGRWQLLPATSVGEGVSFDNGSIVMVTPAPALTLRPGDEIYLQLEDGERGFREVVRVTDSWERHYEVRTEGGGHMTVELPGTVWRVSRVVPYAGVPFALLVGRAQAVLLVVLGMMLIMWSELRKSRRGEGDAAPAPVPTPAASPVTHDTPVPAR